MKTVEIKGVIDKIKTVIDDKPGVVLHTLSDGEKLVFISEYGHDLYREELPYNVRDFNSRVIQERPLHGTVGLREFSEFVKGSLGEKKKGEIELFGFGDKHIAKSSEGLCIWTDLCSEEYPSSYKIVDAANPTSKAAVRLPVERLVEMVDKISYAMSKDIARKSLQQMLLSCYQGVASVVATDGHRLAKYSFPIVEGLHHPDGVKVHIPSDAVPLMKKLGMGYYTVANSRDSFVLHGEGVIYIHSSFEENYPDWARVVPSSYETEVMVTDTAKIAKKVETIAKMSPDKKVESIVLRLSKDGLVLSPRLADDNRYVHPLVGEGPEKEFRACYNWKYLAEAFKATGGENTKIRLNDKFSPFVLQTTGKDGSELLQIIMPVRE